MKCLPDQRIQFLSTDVPSEHSSGKFNSLAISSLFSRKILKIISASSSTLQKSVLKEISFVKYHRERVTLCQILDLSPINKPKWPTSFKAWSMQNIVTFLFPDSVSLMILCASSRNGPIVRREFGILSEDTGFIFEEIPFDGVFIIIGS